MSNEGYNGSPTIRADDRPAMPGGYWISVHLDDNRSIDAIHIPGDDGLVQTVDLRLLILRRGMHETMEHRHWHCSVRPSWRERFRCWMKNRRPEAVASRAERWYRDHPEA